MRGQQIEKGVGVVWALCGAVWVDLVVQERGVVVSSPVTLGLAIGIGISCVVVGLMHAFGRRGGG